MTETPEPEHHCPFPYVPSTDPSNAGVRVFRCGECHSTYDLNMNVRKWFRRTPWTPHRLIAE